MGWIFEESWLSEARLDGKTAVVTGSNTGIGYYTALDFYKRGARVILACRDRTKSITAVENIKKACSDSKCVGEIDVIDVDLSSLQSVRKCAEQLLLQEQKINILVNNAGVVVHKREVTEDGYERMFATNHLGPFLLTLLLLPRLIRSAPARILNLTSEPHCIANNINFSDINCEKTFFYHTAYSQTKLANILFSNELARRLQVAGVSGVNVYAVNPGAVDTNMSGEFAGMMLPGVGWFYERLKWLVMQTAEQGARTSIYCAVTKDAPPHNALYYTNCKVAIPPKAAKDEIMAKALWDLSLEMTQFDEKLNLFLPA